MTNRNPEMPPNLSPGMQAFFDQRNAGYVAIADAAVQKIEAAKGAGTGEAPTADEVAARTAATESVRGDGGRGARQETDYTTADRNAVEQWITTGDHHSKLVKINNALKDLGRICGEIRRLHGWQSLTKATEGLPAHELTDEVHWKQKHGWLDGQFEALRDTNKKQELDAPEKLDGLYLQLHDLLVASQRILFELRKRAEEGSEGDPIVPERRKRLTIPEKLAQAQEFIKEWQDIRSRVARGKLGEFDEAMREHLGITTLPALGSHMTWLQAVTQRTDWNDEEGKKVLTILNGRLSKYPAIVAAAKSVIAQFDERSAKTEARPAVELREGDVWVRKVDDKTERITIGAPEGEKLNASYIVQTGNDPATPMPMKTTVEKLRLALKSGGYQREDRGTMPMGELGTAERVTNFEIQLNAARTLMERWYTLVRVHKAKLYAKLREAGFTVDQREMGQLQDKLNYIADEFHSPLNDLRTRELIAQRDQQYLDETLPELRRGVAAAERAALELNAERDAAATPEPLSGAASAETVREQTALANELKNLEKRHETILAKIDGITTKEGFDEFEASVRGKPRDPQMVIDFDSLRTYLNGKGITSDERIRTYNDRARVWKSLELQRYVAKRAVFYPEEASVPRTAASPRERKRKPVEIQPGDIQKSAVFVLAVPNPEQPTSLTVKSVKETSRIKVEMKGTMSDGTPTTYSYRDIPECAQQLTAMGYELQGAVVVADTPVGVAVAGGVGVEPNPAAAAGPKLDREPRPEKTFEQKWNMREALLNRWNRLYAKYKDEGIQEKIKALRRAEGRLAESEKLPSILTIKDWINQRVAPEAWEGASGDLNRKEFVDRVFPDLEGMVRDAETVTRELRGADEEGAGRNGEETPLDIERRLNNLRLDKALIYEDADGGRNIVTASKKGNEMFILDRPDGSSSIFHISALEAMIFGNGWKFKGTEKITPSVPLPMPDMGHRVAPIKTHWSVLRGGEQRIINESIERLRAQFEQKMDGALQERVPDAALRAKVVRQAMVEHIKKILAQEKIVGVIFSAAEIEARVLELGK